jgi:hypothetical protein
VEALEILQREPWVLETSIFGTYLHASVADEADGRARIAARLEAAGIRVRRLDRIAPSLEDVFIRTIETDARPGGAPA